MTPNLRIRVLPALIPVNGTTAEFRVTETAIEWRLLGSPTWNFLISLAAITGPIGPKTEFQSNGSFLQYRAEGDENWIDLVSLVEIRGPTDGNKGAITVSGTGSVWDLNDIAVPYSGFYVGQGGKLQRLGPKVAIGDATANDGEQATVQDDWLTEFQNSTRMLGGWPQLANLAVENTLDPQNAMAGVFAAQNLSLDIEGLNAIAMVNIAVANNTSNVYSSAFAGYNEAYRMEGAVCGAYAYELDNINFAGPVHLDPFQQDIQQSIGLALGAGGEFHVHRPDLTLYSISGAINMQFNGTTYDTGINIGSNALTGTNGIDGGSASWARLSTGHRIDYYYGPDLVGWQVYPESDANPSLRANKDFVFNNFGGAGALRAPGFRATSPTVGIGYHPGSGGTVTQVTSKGTGVTLNKVTGKITMSNAALTAGQIASFVFTNSAIEADDMLLVTHEGGGTLGAYTVNGRANGDGAGVIDVRNNTAGSLSEALVLRFAIIRSANV